MTMSPNNSQPIELIAFSDLTDSLRTPTGRKRFDEISPLSLILNSLFLILFSSIGSP